MLVAKVLKLILKIVWKFIKLLNAMHLTLALLVAIAGLISYLCGFFENEIYLNIFYVALIFSIIFPLFMFLGKKKDKNKKSKKQVQLDEDNKPVEDDKNNIETEEAPHFYAVKGKPDYVMAEYSDRYELYVKEKMGLKKIRVDYKGEK